VTPEFRKPRVDLGLGLAHRSEQVPGNGGGKRALLAGKRESDLEVVHAMKRSSV
jgi:hypothetical protein